MPATATTHSNIRLHCTTPRKTTHLTRTRTSRRNLNLSRTSPSRGILSTLFRTISKTMDLIAPSNQTPKIILSHITPCRKRLTASLVIIIIVITNLMMRVANTDLSGIPKAVSRKVLASYFQIIMDRKWVVEDAGRSSLEHFRCINGTCWARL